jgi:mono/diheme cytochrome c family protein
MRTLSVGLLALLTAACQQQMAKQPSYGPLEPSEFFADGRASRPLEEGVVARGWPLPGSPPTSGRRPGTQGKPEAPENYTDEFPFALATADLKRGQGRYTIFCTPCHGALGDGQGKIVERGNLKPPSFHGDPSRGFERVGRRVSLREVPVGYLFEVVSRGFGGMPDYAEELEPADRWRVVAYVRALQLSQHAPLESLPPEERAEAQRQLGGKP